MQSLTEHNILFYQPAVQKLCRETADRFAREGDAPIRLHLLHLRGLFSIEL